VKAWDPTSSGKPLGGVNLVIMGDIGQLPPINAASLFLHKLVNRIKANMVETNSGQESLNGAFLWRQLNKVHQYSHETLFGTCTMLCNVVQLLQVSKLQTKPAMSRFRQVAVSKLFCDLL
jgi:hypothetical protein